MARTGENYMLVGEGNPALEEAAAEEVRKALRRYFKRLERRPVILPFVLEM